MKPPYYEHRCRDDKTTVEDFKLYYKGTKWGKEYRLVTRTTIIFRHIRVITFLAIAILWIPAFLIFAAQEEAKNPRPITYIEKKTDTCDCCPEKKETKRSRYVPVRVRPVIVP